MHGGSEAGGVDCDEKERERERERVAAGMRGPWHAGMAACVRAGTVVRRDVRRRATEWNGNGIGGSGSVPHRIHIFFRPRPPRARARV